MATKKILVLRFSSIGDIVLTTPVIRCLAKQIPDAEVHVATKPAFADVLSGNPHIHTIHTLQGSLLLFTRQLSREQFDFVVDLHNNQRTWLIKALLSRPSAAFPKLNLAKWWLVRTKQNRLPDTHIVDRYFQAVRKLGVTNDGNGLDFFIRPEASGELQALQQPIPASYTAVVLGATYATKAMPASKLTELIPHLQQVVLIGGKREQALGMQLQSQFPQQVTNMAGRLSLHGSALMLQNASAVVTPDTGMMHIAAALRKPIVSIWGSTVPAFGMYPYRPDDSTSFAIIENGSLSCRPCSKLGHSACPKGHFACMQDLSTKSIVEAVHQADH